MVSRGQSMGYWNLEPSVKSAIDKAIKGFLDGNDKEIEFPSSLTNEERKYIHQVAPGYGIATKSRGIGANRRLTAYKVKTSTEMDDTDLELSRMSQQQISNFLIKNPLTQSEKRDVVNPNEPKTDVSHTLNRVSQASRFGPLGGGSGLACTTGRLCNGLPQIPPDPRITGLALDEITTFRRALPIWKSCPEILKAIKENSVVLISGDTGCGKTTQVPQFILENAHSFAEPCRIIVAEPRRIAAVSVAERVATERGENVGHTVGYQIRLESRVSPRTLLTFCTNGVLLRTLMGGHNSLDAVTHVILDEVHERDKYSDLLLAVLKDHLTRNTKIRVIIMSATFDTDRFVTYFGGCPVVQVPGNCYPVVHYFLEQILNETKYKAELLEAYKMDSDGRNSKIQKLIDMTENAIASTSYDDSDLDLMDTLEPQVVSRIKKLMKDLWSKGSEQVFEDLLSLYINEGIDVNYTDDETGLTALIIAAARGQKSIVEEFVRLGARISIRTPANEWNAIDWAEHFKHQEIADYLTMALEAEECKESHNVEADEVISANEMSEEDQQLLEAYHRTFDDEEVDLELILELLRHIVANGQDTPKGSVLIFLPGYDEIVNLRQMIIDDKDHFDSNKYVLFTLHSQMQSTDQKKVFKRVATDVRKLILSTNIAETSVTIDDVVYVIDSGKVKEKTFSPLNGVTSMKSVWISQSNARQRKGRAGRVRPGIAYLLYSSHRYNQMPKFRVPEILRVPVHEVCLHVKLLAPGIPLNSFLQTLPDPPSATAVSTSIEKLKAIDAFDSKERLTELGLHLLDLPLDPNLGKMVLYSVALKCLDPILTIVCTLSHRDPFMIPMDPVKKALANKAKKKLACNTLSDHIILLRAFQGWQSAKNRQAEWNFCNTHFISSAAMEMIHGLRTQLLGQLRASGFVRARGSGDIRDLNSNSDNWPIVKAALSAGCYPNLVRIDRQNMVLVSRNERKVRFHPSSIMSLDPESGSRGNPKKILDKFPCDWFVYEELAKVGMVSGAKCCTIIHPLTLALFAGPSRVEDSSPDVASEAKVTKEEGEGENEDEEEIEGIEEDDDEEYSDNEEVTSGRHGTSGGSYTLKIDEWISFRLSSPAASLVSQLRQKWNSLFSRRMTNPAKPSSASDDGLVRTLAEVLQVEEQVSGLEIPAGVGQRPVPMSTEFCPPITSAVMNSPIQRGSSSAANRFGGNQKQWSSSSRGNNSAGGQFVPRQVHNGNVNPGSSKNHSAAGDHGQQQYYRYF